MNLLRLVEVVNTSSTETVTFPLEKTVQLKDEFTAISFVASLKEKGIRSANRGRVVVVRLKSREDVNAFASLYFPELFVLSRLDARVKDSNIPQGFFSRITGAKPTPNQIAVEESIRAIIDRLDAAGVSVAKPVNV